MEKDKILLIEPPFYRLFKDTYSLERYPLSLGYLAGAVKKDTDWEVMVYNSDFVSNGERHEVSYLTTTGFENYQNSLKDLSKSIWKEIKEVILEYRPSVVGISVKSQNFTSACIVAKLVKEIDKQITVIVGGPHPSMAGNKLFECSEIDVGVKGEGEKTIVELLKAIEDNNKEFKSINGIVYKKDNRIIETSPREFIKDLGSLSFPYETAREVLKDYEKYPLSAFKYIFTARGCPFNCFFCGSRKIWSRCVRLRPIENIIKEIKSLQEKGLRSLHFANDTFGTNKQHTINLCNALIEHCPKLKWSCETHVTLVNEQVISLMKKAGCYAITIGIESGNNEILRKIRKGFTIETAFSAGELIRKHGIELHTQFMIGLPWETEETIKDTIAAIKKINCETAIYSIFHPYPGTEAFEFCKENKLIDDNYDLSLYNHQSPANCFCLNITPKRFRELASKMEKMIDLKIRRSRIKRIFSFNTIWKIREMGIYPSLKKGIKIFTGK